MSRASSFNKLSVLPPFALNDSSERQPFALSLSKGVCVVLAVLAASSAFALDYRSLAEPAPMYDAPSAKSKPLFVALAGTPVEVVVSLDTWSKVRDSKGDLVWVEKKFLSEKRTLLVRAERAHVRAAADDKSALVFEAERDVVLELLEAAPGGWLKVRHRDGQSGFVKLTQVWGN